MSNPCYVARHPNRPGAYAACVDDPRWIKDTAKFVSEHVRKGSIVERVTHDECCDLLNEYIKWQRAQEAKQGKLPV